MNFTCEGEYEPSTYWLNQWTKFSIVLMLAGIAVAAITNRPYWGTICYILLGTNICSWCLNRQRFLENEIFRIAKKLFARHKY